LKWVESSVGLAERLEAEGNYRGGRWNLVRRSTVAYQGGRLVYDCIALASAKGEVA